MGQNKLIWNMQVFKSIFEFKFLKRSIEKFSLLHQHQNQWKLFTLAVLIAEMRFDVVWHLKLNDQNKTNGETGLYYAMENHSVWKIHFKCKPNRNKKKNICKKLFYKVEQVAATPNCCTVLSVVRSDSSTFFILCINLSFWNETAYKKELFFLNCPLLAEEIPNANWKTY